MDLELAFSHSTEDMNYYYPWCQILCETSSREALGKGGPHTECEWNTASISEDTGSGPQCSPFPR